MVEDFWPGVVDFYERATSGLSEDELMQLMKLLHKAANGFERRFKMR